MLLRFTRYLADGPPPNASLAAATYLGLAGGFGTGREFRRWNREVQSQLVRSEGLLAYSLQRALGGRNFWTLSLWRDRASMAAFVAATPHRAAAAWLNEGRIRDSKFAHWDTGPGLPSWTEAYARLGLPAPTGRVLQPPTPPPLGWARP